MKKLRYCRYCRCGTKHTPIRINVLGDTDEGIISRIIWGVLSVGASEGLSDKYLECDECGAMRKP